MLYLSGDPFSKDLTMVSEPGAVKGLEESPCIESLLDSGSGGKGYSVVSSREKYQCEGTNTWGGGGLLGIQVWA